jgi:hypothetical protein
VEFSYEKDKKGHHVLEGLQKNFGTKLGPITCDNEVDLPDGSETYGEI